MDRLYVNPELLKRLPPFCWLTLSQRAEVLPHVRRRSYGARSVIQRPDTASEGIFAIISGRVSMIQQDADGHEVIAATLGPGEFFGELGLFEDHTCPCAIRCDRACEVAYLPRCVVVRCLEQSTPATLLMLRHVTSRLALIHHKMAQIALASVYQRVAATMLSYSSDEGGEWVVGVGTEQLARLVASSREMVTRVVNRMIEQGLVLRRGRTLVVLDRAALASEAAGPHVCGGRAKAA